LLKFTIFSPHQGKTLQCGYAHSMPETYPWSMFFPWRGEIWLSLFLIYLILLFCCISYISLLYLYFVCYKALGVYYYALRCHIRRRRRRRCIIMLLYVHFVFTTIHDGNMGKAILIIELLLSSVTKERKKNNPIYFLRFVFFHICKRLKLNARSQVEHIYRI